jgi:hypothetical protein
VHGLVVGAELLSFPLLKALPRVLILPVHVSPMLLILLLPLLGLFFLVLLVHSEKILLGESVALALCLQPRVGLLELLEFFLMQVTNRNCLTAVPYASGW